MPIFCVITAKYTVNCQIFALNLKKFTPAKKIYTNIFVGFVTNMRYVPEPLFLPGGFTIHHCLGLSASALASWPRCWGSIRHSSKKSKWCLPNLTCIAWKLRQRQSLRVIWVKPANKMRAIKGDPCDTWKRLQLNVWVALYERL